ncbi:alpha-glucosidase, glycosyl hydrolase family GH31 [Lentimicrobium saccharophilum]|uniref:Alpha-glucosidase, glycosyl hydrolase family GH31 n=1 Tax=Lentimicrobium saccharophilum TaxID=1678841 RepID=A0A0S7C5L3_9BACT|nr:glycoside hydrolase family 31 protein [Lentimicrobium saccharophilum]GAP44323.1 alpha-glucosidase, glycosyl hydrolase family GH31 [Lentimicrobium saccharophilum]
MKKTILTLALSTLLMSQAFTQGSLSRSLGNLTTFSREGQRLLLNTDYGRAELTVYESGIVRVRIVKDDFRNDFSYAVVADPGEAGYTLEETQDRLVVRTDALRLDISRNPVRFSFYNPDGRLLNTDDPAFGTAWIGTEVTTYKQLLDGERFIGLGEKTGNLDRRGSAYDNWNTDNPRYGPNDDPLYVTIPFYIGMHDSLVYGIFMDNSHRSRFNFGASNDRFSSFSADDGEMDYYFMHAPSVAGILEQYTHLTGRMTMPPLWALGYQQCRWSYFPDTEVLNTAQNFRDRRIPLDVIYLDIHHMDAYKIFTWHPDRFSNPAKLLSDLKAMGIHTTLIVDPGIKVEKGYEAYEDGLQKDIFAKYPDGAVYTAQVWPGWCHFPDFTKPAAREWWGEKFRGLVNDGVTGFWNDMNEIASWGNGYTPHLVEFDWEGRKTSYREAKNVYGLLMSKSTYEGTRKLMNDHRPLILTRAGYSGLQRYTALWTGDNQATDEHMMLGCRLVNSIGLSGVAFTGVDVGGFSKDASPALFARWIGIGAFSPFFRSHTHYDTRQAEPWAYGEMVENISRNYITLRYKLLPYIYSCFRESSLNGMPVARSLAIDYTFDDKIYQYAYQNQYLFGSSILVAPVESTRDLVKVYLPAGEWYDLHSGIKLNGNNEVIAESPLHKLPVYVKAGSVIPMQKPVQSTAESPGGTLFLHIFYGHNNSSFIYYEDDGTSYNYEQGNFYSRRMSFDPDRHEVVLEKATGSKASQIREVKLILHGFPDGTRFWLDGEKLTAAKGLTDLFNALEPGDPHYLENLHKPLKTLNAGFALKDAKMVIKWE